MKNVIGSVLVATSLLTGFTSTKAYAMEPSEYFRLRIEAISLTLEGLRSQIACLKRNDCRTDELISMAERTQVKIYELYQNAGTTPARAALYYTRHRSELDPLFEDGEFADELKKLQREIEAADAELSSLKKDPS